MKSNPNFSHDWNQAVRIYEVIELRKIGLNDSAQTLLENSLDYYLSKSERGMKAQVWLLDVTAIYTLLAENSEILCSLTQSSKSLTCDSEGDNGNINFSPTMQNTTSGANADGNFYRSTTTQSKLKLSLSGGHYNEVLFAFRDDATEGVDRFFDAVKKIGNENFAFYSIIEDDKYAIQGLPEINGEMRIKLGYQLTESKEYKLSIKEIEGISNEYQVIANFNNKSYNLSNQDQLLFIEAGIGEIELIITNAIILSVDNPKELVIFKNSQERLNILVPSDIAKGTIQIIDMTGKTLLRYEDQIIENAHWSKNVNLKPNMIYILKFNSINGNYTRKFIY